MRTESNRYKASLDEKLEDYRTCWRPRTDPARKPKKSERSHWPRELPAKRNSAARIPMLMQLEWLTNMIGKLLAEAVCHL